MKSKSNFRKIIFVFIFSIGLAFAPVQAQKADAWMAIPATLVNRIMAYVQDMVKNILTGAMKQMAIKMISEQVSNVVGGSSSKDSKIISNYKDYLFTQSEKSAQVYINDYISESVGGQDLSSYVSAEGIGDYFPQGSGGADFKKQLSSMAKSMIQSETKKLKTTYVGNPSENLFSDGNLNNFNSYLSGINNPWSYQLYVQSMYQKKLEETRQIAEVKAIAGMGYKGTEKNGKVVTPGAYIASQLSNANAMSFDSISSATSMQDVIAGMVTQFVSQTIQDGIGKSQENTGEEDQDAQNSEENEAPEGEAKPWVNPDNPT
ncbi:MAG TPA: hypothetical protein DIC35_03365 [Candidatus Moranbacteria bacterium]|nr:hypothetical protein [Candidatus Moranbacteria bacterium]